MQPMSGGELPDAVSARRRTPVWIWVILGCGCGCFTLIVAVAAVLYPVFRVAREKARAQLCVSNVRVLATANAMYSSDYDGRLPRADQWMDADGPYAHKDAMHCPSVWQHRDQVYGYAFNSSLSTKAVATITEPDKVQMFYDSTNLARNANDILSSLPLPPRHLGANVVGFLDGHVEGGRRPGAGTEGASGP
jgi:prepilin-type processing-associated H-X9-DG protein